MEMAGFDSKTYNVLNIIATALVIWYFVRGLQLRDDVDDDRDKIEDCRCVNTNPSI